MKTTITSVVVFAALGLATTTAVAQEEGRSWLDQRVAAPSSALELSVGSGYTQGFGMLRGSTAMPDVVTTGIGFDLGVGYRIDPHWGVGLAGQYHELYAEHGHGARGMTAGVAGTYHFNPRMRIDPWFELGTGYRLLWIDRVAPAANVLDHGFELARARVGVDVRVSPAIAIAPVVGADADLFLWERAATHTTDIADARVSTFVFGGLQGRFDIGPSEAVAAPVAQRRPISRTIVTSAPVQIEEETKPVSPSIAVSEEIARACQLHFADVAKAPKFEFDKSDLLPADQDVLEKINECVSTGPLKGQSLRLIGHADPRGTPEYNMALGARRAWSVARFFEDRGIDAARIQQTSRGELDAVGTDEASWAVDRRVDIVLAP